MQLKMIPCPKCGNDFPEKRKELGYHVCVNCSTVKPKVGVTTVEGSGDHTYNDIIIMEQDQYRAIAQKEAELSGRKIDVEILDLDKDEFEVSQSIKESVHKVVSDEYEDLQNAPDVDNNKGIQGIDY